MTKGEAIVMAQFNRLVEITFKEIVTRHGMSSRISIAITELYEEFLEAKEDEDVTRASAIAQLIFKFEEAGF